MTQSAVIPTTVAEVVPATDPLAPSSLETVAAAILETINLQRDAVRGDQTARLTALSARRANLQSAFASMSRNTSPRVAPTGQPLVSQPLISPALVAALIEADRAYRQELTAKVGDLRRRLLETARWQSVARGYRLSAPNRPAFLA